MSSSDEDQYCTETRDSFLVKMKISVLVVDDDQISLATVSSMLRAEMHQAFTAKDPIEALSILRKHQGSIDLVIADYHMSQMNGYELQKKIDAEFKLPVVMMSADDNHNSIAVQSLMNGAVFFIEKPVNTNDLKNIWQYAVASRKRKLVSVLPVDVELSPPYPQDDHGDHNNNQESPPAANKITGIINEDDDYDVNDNNNNTDHHHPQQEDGCSSAPKKAKVVWTNSLHNRFLQAIRYIGLDKAVPKKILDVMNVPGLTRPNVASHLQKYRQFLRRIATKSANQQRYLKSSFASGHQFSTSPATDDHQSVSKPALAAPAGYFGTTQFVPSQYYGTNYIFNAAPAANNWNPFGQHLQQPTMHDQFYTNTGSVATGSNPFGLFVNNSATTFGSRSTPPVVDPALFPETPQPAGAAARRGLLTTSSMAPYSYSTGDYGLNTDFIGSQYSASVHNINNGGLMSSGDCSSAMSGNMALGNQYLGLGLNNTDNIGEDDEVDYGIMSDDSFAMDNMFIMLQMGSLTVEDHDANFADQFLNNQMAPPTPQMLGTGGFPNPNLGTRSNYGGKEILMDNIDKPDHENYSNMFMSMLLGNDQSHHSWNGQMIGEVGTKQLVTKSTTDGAIITPTILESGACPTMSEASYRNMSGYQQTNYGSQGNYGQVPNPSTTEHGINSTPNDQALSSSAAGKQKVYNFYDDDEWDDQEMLEAFLRTDEEEET